jgi:DNA mismatch repair protein MSH6
VCAGAAIAAAVLDHLAHSSRCCGLFATHYHQLAAEHAADPQVAIMHMACAVAEQPTSAAQQSEEGRGKSLGDDDDVAEVTFLYKLTEGGWVEGCQLGFWQSIMLDMHPVGPSDGCSIGAVT